MKYIYIFLLTLSGLWLSHIIIFWIESFLPTNFYLNDSVFFIYPPIFTLFISIYFLYNKKKLAVIACVIAGCVYYIFLMFVFFWGLSESLCVRYFFNLLTNCPGIK